MFAACNNTGDNTNTTNDSTGTNAITQTDSTNIISKDTALNDATTDEQYSIAGFNNPAGFKAFFNTFRGWVVSNNIDSIAAHIQFPLKNCTTVGAFKKDYENLFNAQVKSSVGDQDINHFFANQQGVMTGNGELWFNEINGKYFIIAINNKPVK